MWLVYEIKQLLKRFRSLYCQVKLKTRLYKKVPLPEYDFNELLKKWPYREPCCVSDNFHNLPYNGKINLSFIVPLYNSSAFIERLYSQLANQKTSYKYEIIFVNDGSTDDTDLKVRNLHNWGGGKVRISRK